MTIGILGGGVAGLSCAIALKQKGFEPIIYERATQPSNIGAGIVCWPNASFILRELGVLDAINSVSGSVTAMNRYTPEGAAIGSLDITELNRLMGLPSYSVLRKDLLKILTERAQQLNIPIQYQHAVDSMQLQAGKVKIHFSNGKTITPELILGAEGRMNSLARLFVNGENAPIYQGFVNWVGVFEANHELAPFTELAVSDYWGVGQRFGIVPINKNKAYWAGAAVMEKKTQSKTENYPTELNSLFSSWPSPIGKLINETPAASIQKIYVHDHNPISCWHKHNVLLVGDAAHAPLPTSGQGACQALEDAWHFANCLTENRDNYQVAFEQFTQLRQPKTSGIIHGGRQLAASIFNTDAQYCKQRDNNSRTTDYRAAVEGMAKGWSSGLPNC